MRVINAMHKIKNNMLMQAKFSSTSISQLATEGMYHSIQWTNLDSKMQFFFACLLTLGSGCYAYVNASAAADNFV